MMAAMPLGLLAAAADPEGGGFPLPFMSNFPPFGSWSTAQLFPCEAGSANQTAAFNASSGLLSLKGSCLGVSDYSFGQDGQTIGAGGCDPEQADDMHRWSHNATDRTLRSVAYPTICLHAATARPMAPLIQKTCHSVVANGSYDPRDQWDLGAEGAIRSVANASLCVDGGSALPPFVCTGQAFCDSSQPAAARVKDLISRMDLGEKTLVLNGDNPGVPRLGVPPFSGGDSLHGVGGCGASSGNGSTGCGTSFPHALALAATFNRTLWRMVGDAIGTEGRGLVNQGLSGMLNPWDPDINLVRGAHSSRPSSDLRCLSSRRVF